MNFEELSPMGLLLSFLRPIVSDRAWGYRRLRYSQVMSDELVTVFRSADPSAMEDAEGVRELLAESGLAAVLLDDQAPGVPSGAVEVRVPSEQAKRADEVLAASDENAEPAEPGDPSDEFDLETIFEDMGTNAEVEAIGIRAVLDANGIPSVLVDSRPYPSLRFIVRVPRREVDRARQILEEARAAGPTAAEEAEKATEE